MSTDHVPYTVTNWSYGEGTPHVPVGSIATDRDNQQWNYTENGWCFEDGVMPMDWQYVVAKHGPCIVVTG